MATSNSSRAVRLDVEIETIGEESLRRAADDLRRLAKEGGDAAPALATAALELDRLGNQAGAIASVRALTEQLSRLTAEQAESAAKAQAVGVAYTEQRVKAEALRAEQQRLEEAIRQARIAQVDAAASLATLKTQYDAAGRQTLAFTSEQTRLVDAIGTSKRVIAETRAEVDRLGPSVVEATAAERKLAAQFEALTGAANGGVEAIRRQESALGQASAAALAAGAAVGNLALADEALASSVQDVLGATNRLNAAQRESAAGAVEGAAAVRQLEQAAQQAFQEMRDLAQSLQAAERAAVEFAAASERAAASGKDDARALREQRAAAEALVDAERQLTRGQRELAAERNAGRAALVAEAQAYLQSARAADESRAATARMVSGAREAGAALESAFGKTGVRSLQALEAEIRDVDVALSLLERKFRAGALSAAELDRATASAAVRMRTLQTEIEKSARLPTAFEGLNSKVNDLIGRFGALTAAVGTIAIAVRPVIEATVALDQMRRVLATVSGSAEVAEKQIAFLRRTASESGQSFTEIGQSYAKFAASALQSGLSLDQTQSVFKAVSLAAGNLGLSSDQAKRALEALSQIASKGVVSMEELRQQLGDALPGVLPLLAKELGLTQRELIKVVESGQLLATEAIPAIGKSLAALGPQTGTVNGIVATFNRFKNVVLEAGTAIVEGPLGQAAGPVLVGLAQAVGVFATIVVSASEALKLLGITTLATLDAVRGNTSFAEAGKTISDFAAQSGEKIKAFQDRVDAIAGSSASASEGLGQLGKTAGFTGESFAKLTLEQQKLIDAAAVAAQSAEKAVQGAKAEADAITRLAGLLGDEVAAKEASAQASLLIADATSRQLVADKALLASHEALKAATLDRVAAGKESADGVKALVEETDKHILKAQADVEKTQAQANATRALALERELAVRSIGDQSGALDTLRQKVEAATAAQDLASRRFAEGKGSLTQLTTATDALALAKGLLRDAIDDLDKALKRQIDTAKADVAIKRASLALDLELAKTALRKAEEAGNETAARQANIRILEIEQALARTGTQSKLAEADATLRFVKAKEDELRATGQLTPEKQLELDLIRKGAVAATLEAAATGESNRAKDEAVQRAKGLLPALNDLSKASGDLTGKTREQTGALGANNELLREAVEATDKASAAAKRYRDALDAVNPRLVSGSGLGGIGPTQAERNATNNSPPPAGAPVRTAGGFQLPQPAGPGPWTFVPDQREGSGVTPETALRGEYSTSSSIKAGGLGVIGVGYWTSSASATSGLSPAGGTFGQGGFGAAAPAGSTFGQGGLGQSAPVAGRVAAPSVRGPSPLPTSAPAPSVPLEDNSKTVVIRFELGGKPISVTSNSPSEANRLVAELQEAFRQTGGGG